MKKLLTALVAVGSLALLAGCGGTKTADVPADTTPVVETTPATTPTTTKVDATKDQCLQMVIAGMNLAMAQTKGDQAAVKTRTNKGSALEEQMRAGNVEYEQACNKYMTDQDFMKKVQESLQEK